MRLPVEGRLFLPRCRASCRKPSPRRFRGLVRHQVASRGGLGSHALLLCRIASGHWQLPGAGRSRSRVLACILLSAFPLLVNFILFAYHRMTAQIEITLIFGSVHIECRDCCWLYSPSCQGDDLNTLCLCIEVRDVG